MEIKDRGILKWRGAAFMPAVFEMQRDMLRDEERLPMPELDEYQTEEFDARICLAMEYRMPVKLSVWENGFTSEIVGRVHVRDEITRELRVRLADGAMERVKFAYVVGVEVVED